MRQHDIATVRSLASKALDANGSFVGPTRVQWDVSGSCEASKTFEVYGRPENGTVIKGVTPNPVGVEMTVRCRKCPQCLKQRQILWRERARVETRLAARTWFGTLTLSPERQAFYAYAAAHRLTQRGVRWEGLTDAEQFRHRHGAIGKAVTRYLKRVRKESGARFRYLLVCEAHKTGLPHYHALVHETDLGRGVSERSLRLQWTEGFSRWKLVNDDRSALYLTKYLSKSVLARVRASQRYGRYDLTSQGSTSAPREILTPDKTHPGTGVLV